ncbi:hypothetical protein J6590_084807 [Homalodisca vitripennis]|nr:hypothetical protein J6590_084807 [Homalodisca vitripennis]
MKERSGCLRFGRHSTQLYRQFQDKKSKLDCEICRLEEEPPLLYSTSTPSRCGFKTALPLFTQQVRNVSP